MLALLPHLQEDLQTKGRLDGKALQEICAWMLRGMGDQRSTDLGTLKHVSLTYLMPNHEPLEPPINKKEDKSDRGFNHPQIARMLCPCNKLIVFDEDPDTQVPTFSPTQLLTHCRIMSALQEGLINTTACNWPTIFYMDNVYDPDDRLKGLFCGHAAFRFYTHLFIGPAAAATDTVVGNVSRPSKNALWGLTSVTPQVIAYVHVLLYFTLSTAPRWCQNVGQMNLDEMASLIIEMFSNPDNWTCTMLAWWNKRAFPKPALPNPDSDNDIATIRAQRTKKTKHLSNFERHCAAGRDFTTPTPEPEMSEVPSTSASSSTSLLLSNSTTSTSVTTVCNVGTGGEDSDLSPPPSDNEGAQPALPQIASIIPAAIGNATLLVSQSRKSPNGDLGAGPAKPKKKAPAKKCGRKNGF